MFLLRLVRFPGDDPPISHLEGAECIGNVSGAEDALSIFTHFAQGSPSTPKHLLFAREEEQELAARGRERIGV
jgi:hypothetical protein